MLRFAVPDDAEALRAIYAQYIDTSVTFEYELPTAEEFRRRIEDISAEYPYLVWEEDGVPLGYAYAHRFHERAAYQWSIELSIYLAPDARGKGLGRKLYAALIDLIRLQGARTAYGRVTHPNEPSESFHRAMGFREAGVIHNAGWKNGAWHDVTTFELPIAPYDTPEPLKSFRDVDPAAVARVLAERE